jgi:hypothetical protein
VQQVLRYFTKRGLEVGLLVPTGTGMGKGIMDATGNIRDFLRNSGLHDYDTQPQGTAHKRKIPTRLVTSSGIVGTTTSLYRPVTKHGDPRLWIYGLAQHAEPGNVLVLIASGTDELLVINASNSGLVPGVDPPANSRLEIRDATGVDIDALLAPLIVSSNEIAIELLGLMQAIAGNWHKGIPGVRRDTEVGRLLEELLGIRANSSRSPDYKGIEIKAGRSRSTTRQSLFAKVPDWSISHLKSSAAILDAFGYQRGDHHARQLRCTVSSKKANTQGLFLALNNEQNQLLEASNKPQMPKVVVWRIQDLKDALQKKHPETFWVTASSRRSGESEEFRYDHVLHTKKPMVNALPALLDAGVVTVDHLITRSLKGHVKEQGPLFKIWRRDMDLLFPPGDFYSLSAEQPE